MALLTSADFADLISPQLLINLTRGTSAPDEDVIDKCSAAAWDEMFLSLGVKFAQPTTCPAGPAKELLRKVTRYGLYSQRPELLATLEGEVITRERAEALKFCEKARDGDAVIPGLTLKTADESAADGSSLSYYSNAVVYTRENYRGF